MGGRNTRMKCCRGRTGHVIRFILLTDEKKMEAFSVCKSIFKHLRAYILCGKILRKQKKKKNTTKRANKNRLYDKWLPIFQCVTGVRGRLRECNRFKYLRSQAYTRAGWIRTFVYESLMMWALCAPERIIYHYTDYIYEEVGRRGASVWHPLYYIFGWDINI